MQVRRLLTLALAALATLGAAGAATAQDWTRQAAGEISFEAPAHWVAQTGVPAEQIMLMEKPDRPETGAAFGVVREHTFPDLPPSEPVAVQVGGKGGMRYDWQDEEVRGYFVLLDEAGPDGRRIALITGSPTEQWEAAVPVFERIIGSVAFGAAAPAPTATPEPAAASEPAAADIGGQPLAFSDEVPEAARAAVDAVAASGMQDGAVYRVAMADLNGDGTDEVLVHIKHANWCSGWGDKCRTVVLRHAEDGSWVSMGYPYAETVTLLPSKTEGWTDLRFDGDTSRYGYDQYVAAQ